MLAEEAVMVEKITVAISCAGHDKGTFYAVIQSKDGLMYVADGKHHKIDAPKKKNPRHLHCTNIVLPAGSTENNKRLRKALTRIKESACIETRRF
jgi:ribosomal protein L14E/L6E/L27E